MSLDSYTTNEPKELIVRSNYKRILVWAILMTIPCIGLLTDSYENWKKIFTDKEVLLILTIPLLYGGTVYLWCKVFDKRIKLIINKNGIIYSEFKFNDWINIESFRFKDQQTVKAGIFSYLILETRLRKKEYVIDITHFNKTPQEIKTAIVDNSIKFSVIDLGVETNKKNI